MDAITYEDQLLPDAGYGMSRLEEFCRDSLRRRSWLYVIWLMLALGMSTVAYRIYRGSATGSLGPMQAVYYLIAAVHVVRRLKMGGRANIFAPDVVFLLFYTCFHLGYVSLFYLGTVPYSSDVFFYTNSIPKAMHIVNIGLIGFLVGYEVLGSKGTKSVDPDVSSIPGENWAMLGIVMMILAIIMHIVGLMTLGADTIQRYGYAAIAGAYRYADSYFTVLMLTESTIFMILGLVVYLICSSLRHGRLFHSKFALGLTLFYILMVLLEGERGTVLKLGLPILMVRHYFIKRVKIRWLAVLFATSIIVFVGLAVVRKTVFNPGGMLKEYKYQKQSGQAAWYNAFAEMGQSFLVVDITCNDVPKVEPYWKGASWGSAAIHTVPFLQGYAMRRGWIRWEPSKWVTTTYFGTERAGRGFTVAAEGYLNFGFIGTFAELLLLGLFVRWLTVKFGKHPSAVWALIMLGCLGPVIMVIRNHSNLLPQPILLVILAAAFINMFLGQEHVEAEEHEEAFLGNLSLAHP